MASNSPASYCTRPSESQVETSAELDRYDYDYDPRESATPKGTKSRFSRARKVGLWLSLVVAMVVLVAFALALAPRWWTPTESSIMRGHQGPYVYQWVDADHISRYMIAATISHEDIAFLTRAEAFDVGKYIATTQQYLGGNHDVAGGSTIPQQLVKNLYLTPDSTPVRKAVEALLATPTAVTLSKPRMMELYLNYAQFGPDIFGICAASWYYFGEPPWSMSLSDAAQLSSVLPLPSEARRVDSHTGGIYVLGPKSEKTFRADIRRVIYEVKYVGYRPMMSDIGINDDASDHADQRGETTSCSTMPENVREHLVQNGYGG